MNFFPEAVCLKYFPKTFLKIFKQNTQKSLP